MEPTVDPSAALAVAPAVPPAAAPAGVPATSAFDRLQARRLLLWLVAATLIVAVAVVGTARVAAGPGDSVAIDERLVSMLTTLAGALVVVALARHARLDWRRVFGSWPTSDQLPLVLVIVPVALLTFGMTLAVYIPLSYVAPGLVRRLILEPRSLFEVTTVAQWALLMLVGAVAAPMGEEVLFRGLLMQRWARRWGTMTGVVASSALFALLHEEWVGHFAFGVALCALYLRTRRLWVPMLAHALNNAIFLAPQLGHALHHTREPVQTLADFRGDAPWIAPLLAAAALTGWLYLRWWWTPGQLSQVLRGPTPYEHHAAAMKGEPDPRS